MAQVVLAEDSHDQARILIAILKKAGIQVQWFENGQDAFQYLSTVPGTELLITDVLMPGMSGFELLARLKEIQRMPPTLVLTSKQREEDILRGLEFGVLDYITKPFSPSVILAKVKNIVGRAA